MRSRWPTPTGTRRSFPIGPVKPKTPPSQTLPLRRRPRRSRPARFAAPTASPSTTSCCASRKRSARPRATPAATRSSASSADRASMKRGWFLAIVALLLLLLGLQARLWWGEGGLREARQLRAQVAEQKAENARLQQRNDALAGEV